MYISYVRKMKDERENENFSRKMHTHTHTHTQTLYIFHTLQQSHCMERTRVINAQLCLHVQI